MHDFRTIIGKLNFIASQRALANTTREFALKTASVFRGPVDKARNTVEALGRIEAFHDAEVASWLEPEDILAGKGGGFDACDLRHWLIIAEKAGVKAVPATEILSLSEDELSALSGKITLPGHISKAIGKGLSKAFPEAAQSQAPQEAPINMASLTERLHDAMDDVPYNAIVRSHVSGPSTLKAFAGAGVITDGADSMKLDKDLEVGPGWVRHGNRRRVDATDSRLIENFAGGHKPRIHYLARPWVEAARRNHGEDPHRHGTPFAGKGSWPVEWRVFVEGGKVTGVASYYGWCGQVTPTDAARALEAVELAQKMVDWAIHAGLSSRFMDLEFLRNRAPEGQPESPDVVEILERFPRDAINCTLDFIEVKDEGMMFLEGGPAHTPIGGGHPCAFAGHNASRTRIADCTGVALRLCDDVILADPKTWRNAKGAENYILSWEAAKELAASENEAK